MKGEVNGASICGTNDIDRMPDLLTRAILITQLKTWPHAYVTNKTKKLYAQALRALHLSLRNRREQSRAYVCIHACVSWTVSVSNEFMARERI